MSGEPPTVDTAVSATDQLHASAVQFLLGQGCKIAARILLSSETSFAYNRNHVDVTLRASDLYCAFLSLGVRDRERIARGDIDDKRNFGDTEAPVSVVEWIEKSFAAVLPGEISTVTVHSRVTLLKVNPDWRQEFGNVVFRINVDNQGITLGEDKPLHIWHNLRFRSQTEIRIAEALEQVDKPPVLYLPNCLARLGFAKRENREADFLICRKGKWGILEVDGPFSHPARRKVDDDERARLFKAHGIHVIEHFDAGDCWEDPHGVVKQFLYLLGQ